MSKDKHQEKQGRYERVLIQAQDLVTKARTPTSRMATVAALLHHKMRGFFWTGFYLLEGDDLVVGPYQGPLACSVLGRHRGVCWASVDQGEVMIVPDVKQFPGHIACDSRSKSEIVVPIRRPNGTIAGVLDVDSTELGRFDEADGVGLKPFADLIYSA